MSNKFVEPLASKDLKITQCYVMESYSDFITNTLGLHIAKADKAFNAFQMFTTKNENPP